MRIRFTSSFKSGFLLIVSTHIELLSKNVLRSKTFSGSGAKIAVFYLVATVYRPSVRPSVHLQCSCVAVV